MINCIKIMEKIYISSNKNESTFCALRVTNYVCIETLGLYAI